MPVPECSRANDLKDDKMKNAEVREILYETLRPVLAPGNFRLNKSQQAFVRDIACGTQHIGIPLWDYNPRFDSSLAMTMRIEAAEAITNRFSGSPPKYQPQELNHYRCDPLLMNLKSCPHYRAVVFQNWGEVASFIRRDTTSFSSNHSWTFRGLYQTFRPFLTYGI